MARKGIWVPHIILAVVWVLQRRHLRSKDVLRNVRKPGKTALEGSLRSLRDGIDGFTGKACLANIRILFTQDWSC